jgi:hypothetical protein
MFHRKGNFPLKPTQIGHSTSGALRTIFLVHRQAGEFDPHVLMARKHPANPGGKLDCKVADFALLFTSRKSDSGIIWPLYHEARNSSGGETSSAGKTPGAGSGSSRSNCGDPVGAWE